MSVNKHKTHVTILPEDDANRQIALGFVNFSDSNQIQILPVAGGWVNVCSTFLSNYARDMERFEHRRMILLVDFDDDPNRPVAIRNRIENKFHDRVFILGVWSEPERLKAALRCSFEVIGQQMAEDCRGDTRAIWVHDLLQHNEEELGRLRAAIGPILFP